MSCPHCDLAEAGEPGVSAYPQYGIAPHYHELDPAAASFLGSTRFLPRQMWPDNFVEDPDEPGCGTYYCPECKADMPERPQRSQEPKG